MATPPVSDHIRTPRKVLYMVAELHLRGYQRLRIVPHFYEIGTWRCGITPIENTLRSNGAVPASLSWEVLPQYSSAQMRQYFGWNDAAKCTPSHISLRIYMSGRSTVRALRGLACRSDSSASRRASTWSCTWGTTRGDALATGLWWPHR